MTVANIPLPWVVWETHLLDFQAERPEQLFLLNPLALDKGGTLCLAVYRVNQSEFEVKVH